MNFMTRCMLILTIILTGFTAAYAQAGESESSKGTASISGQITSGGKPVRGIVVFARPEHKNPQQEIKYMLGQVPMPRSVTDAEGKFAFTGLEAGSYDITINASAMVGMRLPTNASNEAHNNPSIIVGDGDSIENINFSVTRGGIITGRVTRSDGSPAIRESVKAQPQLIKGEGFTQLSRLFSSFEAFTTDDRGIYRIYGLADGRYKVVAGTGTDPISIAFNRNRRTKQVFYPGTTDEATAGVVEISGGNEVRDVDIKLSPSESTYLVKGRVIDETGKPAPKVIVNYSAVDAKSGAPLSPFAEPATVTTDSQGEFTVMDLATGTYKFNIGAASGRDQSFYSDEPEVQVNNANVSGIEIHLHNDVPVSGQVIIEGANDAAIFAKQQITIYLRSYTARKNDPKLRDSTTAEARVTPDGQFTFRGLKPSDAHILLSPPQSGLVIVRVERNGADKTDGFEIQAGEPISDLRVIMAQTNSKIHGQIKVEGGTLPKGATLVVSAYRLRDGEPFYQFNKYNELRCEVGSDGQFILSDLAAGQYEMFLIGEGYVNSKQVSYSTSQKVTVANGQELDVVMTLDLSSKVKDK